MTVVPEQAGRLARVADWRAQHFAEPEDRIRE
jgi:hypothetical protein